MPDLQFYNHGSIVTVEAVTDDGRAWIADNLPDDVLTWGSSIVIEPRYVESIVNGARADGMACEG